MTVEQLVAWFHRFCDETSIFIATQAPRPEGLETAFSIDLADGEPALAGEGVVTQTWTTRDNRYKAPGMQIEIKSVTRPSARVFEQMLIARAVTQDQAKPKPVRKVAVQNEDWSDDGTDVGAPTFDDLAAGKAPPISTQLPSPVAQLASAQAAASPPPADQKSVAKHTLIGLPAIAIKPLPKPPMTIAVGPTPPPKIEPVRAPQPKLGTFVVPAKIAPVAGKKGPVVITPLHATTGSNAVVQAAPVAPVVRPAAKPAGPVVITPLRAVEPAPATRATAAKAPIRPVAASTAMAAAAKPAPKLATPQAVPIVAAPIAAAPSGARISQQPSSLTMGWDAQPDPAESPIAAAPKQPGAVTMGWDAQPDPTESQPVSPIAAAPKQPGALTMGWDAQPDPTESPIAAAPMAAAATPARAASPVSIVSGPNGSSSMAVAPTPPAAPPSILAHERAPAVVPAALARGSSAPMAIASTATPAKGTATASTATPPAGVAAAPNAAISSEISARIPRAATQLGSGPIARMPAVIYDTDLDDIDVQLPAPESTNVDALGASDESIVTASPGETVNDTERVAVPTIAHDLAMQDLAAAAQNIAPSADFAASAIAEDVAGSSMQAPAIASLGDDDALAIPRAPVIPTRATSESTWDELALVPSTAHAIPATAAPPPGSSAALRAAAQASFDADQAAPLPPAPDASSEFLAETTIEPPPKRRRRGARIAIGAVAMLAIAAAAVVLFVLAPWSTAEEPSPVPPPTEQVVAMSANAAPAPAAEIPTPVAEVPAPVAEVAPPVAEVPVPVAEVAPPVEQPVAVAPPVESPVAAPAEEPAATPPPTEAAPPVETKPAAAEGRTTKIAKKPARVKRVSTTRAKARPKRKKASSACTDLSCL